MPANGKGQESMQNKLFLIAVLLSMILVPVQRPFGVRHSFCKGRAWDEILH